MFRRNLGLNRKGKIMFDKIKVFYEDNRDIINNVVIPAAVIMLSLTAVAKVYYERGYLSAIVDIIDKNEGKLINI